MLKAKREQLRSLIFGVTPTFSLNLLKGLLITIPALIFKTNCKECAAVLTKIYVS